MQRLSPIGNRRPSIRKTYLTSPDHRANKKRTRSPIIKLRDRPTHIGPWAMGTGRSLAMPCKRAPKLSAYIRIFRAPYWDDFLRPISAMRALRFKQR